VSIKNNDGHVIIRYEAMKKILDIGKYFNDEDFDECLKIEIFVILRYQILFYDIKNNYKSGSGHQRLYENDS